MAAVSNSKTVLCCSRGGRKDRRRFVRAPEFSLGRAKEKRAEGEKAKLTPLSTTNGCREKQKFPASPISWVCAEDDRTKSESLVKFSYTGQGARKIIAYARERASEVYPNSIFQVRPRVDCRLPNPPIGSDTGPHHRAQSESLNRALDPLASGFTSSRLFWVFEMAGLFQTPICTSAATKNQGNSGTANPQIRAFMRRKHRQPRAPGPISTRAWGNSQEARRKDRDGGGRDLFHATWPRDVVIIVARTSLVGPRSSEKGLHAFFPRRYYIDLVSQLHSIMPRSIAAQQHTPPSEKLNMSRFAEATMWRANGLVPKRLTPVFGRALLIAERIWRPTIPNGDACIGGLM